MSLDDIIKSGKKTRGTGRGRGRGRGQTRGAGPTRRGRGRLNRDTPYTRVSISHFFVAALLACGHILSSFCIAGFSNV
jgi:hypothetical protein